MKTKSILSLFLIAIAVLLTYSCVKEGPRGPAGQNGIDGNANVIASPWISPTAWSLDTARGLWYFGVTSTAITSDIVETGAILGYMSIPGDIYAAGVRPLPSYAANANWDFQIPDYGKIEFSTDAQVKPGTSGYTFRFILISSSATISLKSGTISGYKKSELQNLPYSEVCKILGIKE